MVKLIPVFIFSSLTILSACGGGGSSTEDSNATTSSDIQTTENVNSQCLTTSRDNNLDTTVNNSCSFDVNAISTTGNRILIPNNSSSTTGIFLIAFACQAPLNPANSSIIDNSCI